MADTLGSISVEFLGNMTRLEHDMDRAFDRATSQGRKAGERTGASLGDGIRAGLKNALGSGGGGGGLAGSIVGDLTGGSIRGSVGVGILRGLVGVGTAASNAATDVRRYRTQLVDLAGDVKRGEAALARFSQTAKDSEFSKDQVLQIGTAIAGRTGDVEGATRDTQRLVDAGARLGVNNSTFDSYQRNIGQVLGKQNGKVDSDEIRELRTMAPALAYQIGRAMGTSTAAANKLLDTGTGKEVYDAILAIGDASKGAAKRNANGTPQGIISNIGEDMTRGLASTGERLNQALLGPLTGVQAVTTAAANFNEATGGNAGMVAMIGAGTVAVKLLVDGGRKAWLGVTTLTSAIERLAVVSDMAAASAGRQAAAQTVANAGGMMVPSIGMGGAPGAAGAAGAAGFAGKGFRDRMRSIAALPAFARYGREGLSDWSRIHLGEGVGQSLLGRGLALGKGLTAIGLPLVGQFVGSQMMKSDNKAVSWAGGTLTAASTGFGIGATIGSVVPGVGTAIGGAVGAGVGALADTGQRLYENYASGGEKDKSASALERIARATEDTAKHSEMSAKMIGGGPRAQYKASLLEREYATYHLMRGNATGFA